MKSLSVALLVLLMAGSSGMAAVIADYCFDESDDTVAIDSSGNGNDGTLFGFTNYEMGYADDIANAGYTSNGMLRLVKGGLCEYIQSAIVARNLLTGSFTIEAITSLHSDPWYWQPLIGYVIPDEAFVYWGSGVNDGTSAPPHWHIDNGGPWMSYDDYKEILTDGQMHHYAIAYDAGEGILNMYLDSVDPIATVFVNLSGAVPEGDTGLLLIGSHMGSSSYEVWNGLIDRIRFSDNFVSPQDFIAIPEPTTILMLSFGLAVLRKRK
ncbi:MAG: PEP-CTERM sorting domain-containing protein [Planctomycetaceae bacterium]|nr:PEP-CTERM sorting domain-containing protein [Planctomycetaceae bacterium]